VGKPAGKACLEVVLYEEEEKKMLEGWDTGFSIIQLLPGWLWAHPAFLAHPCPIPCSTLLIYD
jgi:hypothetical protein